MLVNYFIFGVILAFMFIIVCFGFNITAKSKPKIKINYHPFIVDSHILICNKHLHHWLISFILFTIVYFINRNSRILYIMEGFFMTLIIHGLLYKDCFDFEM